MKRESHHSAGFVVFREAEERQFLLVRSALTRRPVWEFPKGAIEPGETRQEAARRELREETGLGPGSYELVEGFHDLERYVFTRGAGPDRRLIRKEVAYYLARWIEGEVLISREASRYTWAAADEAVRLLRFPEKKRVLANADGFLRDQQKGAESPALAPLPAR